MEISTFIIWNAVIYLLYYTGNILYDYWRHQRLDHQSIQTYTYDDLIHEQPEKVSLKDYRSNEGSKGETRSTKMEKKPVLVIDGPVADQGIPMHEFLKNMKSYASEINF